MYNLSQKIAAEFIGTAFLLATVVGSGIMAEQLSGGNIAVALLGNTIPTGAILFVLITMFGPISGAHFNPAVTLVFYLRQELTISVAVLYVVTQIVAGLTGVVLAHIMFNLDVLQFSQKSRVGTGQWVSEFIATFGLIMTILTTLKFKEDAVAMAVGLYITAAYWFTASTSFANPAVSIARAFTDTFAGIKPAHVGFFIVCQLLAAVVAWVVCSWLLEPRSDKSSH